MAEKKSKKKSSSNHDRLITIETLLGVAIKKLDNHLKSHSRWLRLILIPILLGVLMIVANIIYSYLRSYLN